MFFTLQNSNINFRMKVFFSILTFLFLTQEIQSQLNYPIVFVSRNQTQFGHAQFPQMGMLPGMGAFSRFTAVGGKLMIRETSGNIVTLVDSSMSFNGISLYDVQQPCVHWDGERILFSGIEHPDSNWRIYEIKKDGTGFRKVTHTNRIINLSQFGIAAYKFEKYDDIDPAYLPNGNIIFASTRFPSIDMISGKVATNIFQLDILTNRIQRITTERNGAEKPTIDPINGHIVFTRKWVNIDLPSDLTSNGVTRDPNLSIAGSNIANIWQLASMRIDADELMLFAGDPRTRVHLSGYRPRIDNNGNLLSVFVPHLPMVMTGGSTGIFHTVRGLNSPNYLVGVNPTTPVYQNLPMGFGIRVAPYATDPVMLPDGKIIFSMANSVIDQNYGLYITDLNATNVTSILSFPNTSELNAEVLMPRNIPPIPISILDLDTNSVPPDISNPATLYQSGVFRFDAMNVFSNAPVDAPIEDAPDIKQNVKIRFFANFQRQDTAGRDHPILIDETDVELAGLVIQGDAPANVSMFEQLIDEDGNILRSTSGTIAHVTGFNYAPTGTGTKCVGCHAGHTIIEVAPNITLNQFTNVSTSATVNQSSYYNNDTSYSGKKVKDRKARNPNPNVNWIAGYPNNQFIELEWDILIDVKEVVMYNILPNPVNGTNINITDATLRFFRDENVVHEINWTGTLDTSGTFIQVSPWMTINKLRVEINSFTGNIFNQNLAGLAEIETIGRISLENVVSVSNESEIAETFELKQNFPNPFNPVTKIPFSLPQPGFVSLKVYDLTGREIETLVSGNMTQGYKEIFFDASRFASGIYIYRVIFETRDNQKFSASKKMVVLK